MAAKKKKAKKAAKPKKAKKAAAKKSRKAAKKPAKKTKKVAKKSMKTAARKAPAKAAMRPARKTMGEGDYAASRSFLKDQSGFVEKNRAKIPAMGKAAEAALDGPQGDMLRDAEATAAARSRDTF